MQILWYLNGFMVFPWRGSLEGALWEMLSRRRLKRLHSVKSTVRPVSDDSDFKFQSLKFRPFLAALLTEEDFCQILRLKVWMCCRQSVKSVKRLFGKCQSCKLQHSWFCKFKNSSGPFYSNRFSWTESNFTSHAVNRFKRL